MCPPPGKTSSTPIVDTRDAVRLLDSVCESEFITGLSLRLGESASLHLVGGTVRDAFAGVLPADLDLASRLSPSDVKQRLEGSGFRVVETGLSHGTVLLLHASGQAELTTFRKPGPRDSSEFSEDIKIDLSGRDFTINAIAYDVKSRTLVDPYGGGQDLHTRSLKAVGSAATRFAEDPLRVLRLVRFGPADGRTVEQATFEAAKTVVLDQISTERIRDELYKTLTAPLPANGLRFCHLLGLFEQILPEIIPAVGFAQNRFHSEDVFEHTLTVIERCPADLILRLTALFHDLGKPHTLTIDSAGERHFYKHEQVSEDIARSVMERLHTPKNHITAVTKLVRHHMRPLDCGPPGVRRILRDLGGDFDRWLQFKIADKPPTMADDEFQNSYDRFVAMVEDEQKRLELPSYGKLAVNGNDLIALGFSPGPQIGAILSQLEELVIEDPEKNIREELLNFVRQQELI